MPDLNSDFTNSLFIPIFNRLIFSNMQFTIHKNADTPGSEKWFEDIYHEHFEKLLRYAYSITERKEMAEDVVSEVFITFWNRRNQSVEIKNVEAYLIQSVKHLSIRKLKNAKTETLSSVDESKYQHSLDPEHILIGKELESVISEVVDSLTPHGKLVYDMARNKGLSNQMIAKELDMNEATVRKHLSNVMKAFKTALDKHLDSKKDDQSGSDQKFRIGATITLLTLFVENYEILIIEGEKLVNN